MKKIFQLQQDNKHPDRVLESIKHEIRKYLKRERKKKLPEDAVFWDFDCQFGKSADGAQHITASELTAALDKAKAEHWEVCYVEIKARAAVKHSSKEEV